MRIKPVTTILLGSAALLLDASVALGQGAQRRQPPPPAPERPFTFPAHSSVTLDNGLTVFVVEDHRQPMVSATLMIPGAGSGSHSREKAGLAAMTAALARQGTATRSAQQIAEGIERVGGSLSTSAGRDAASASVTVVTTALETGFELLADVVQRPAFAAAEIERWRRQSLSGLQVAYSDPEYLRNVVATRVGYGDHPYGVPTDGTPETLRALGREDVVNFHRERYTPSGSFLAIAGDITPDAAATLARRHFGAWKGAATSPPAPPKIQPGRRIVVIDKPDAVQTQFGFVGAGVPRDHPDWLALAVANQVLGAGFNSRLNMRLRAQEGLTYGARSAFESNRLGGLLTATSFTRTEETAKAITLSLEVIEEFRKNPVTPAELAEATSYLSGVFAIQSETAGAVAGRVLTSAVHGLPADYWQTYRERVRKISPSDVAAAVERHVVPAQLSIVAVGNAGAFAKALGSLGPVTIVPGANVDLTQPGLVAKRETAAGPEAAARGMALVKDAAEAIGGGAALSGVKDATNVGEVTIVTPGGELQGKATATVLHPDKVKVAITLPVGELVQVFDGSAAWMRMGPQPASELPAPMHTELQRSIYMSGGIGILREALQGRAEVVALESRDVEGKTLDRVLWKKGEMEMTVGFDPASHRIVNVSYRGMTPQGTAESEIRYADFKPTAAGLTLPTRTTTYQNGQRIADLVISEWRINDGVSPDTFVKPQ